MSALLAKAGPVYFPDGIEAWEELLQTLVLAGTAVALSIAGRRHRLRGRRGWSLVLAGFWVLAVRAALDFVDEFEFVAAWPGWLVSEPWGAMEIFTESVGVVAGTLLLTSGFLLWLPLPARLSKLEAELRAANQGLEARVHEATAASLAQQRAMEQAQAVAHVGSWRIDLRNQTFDVTSELRRMYDLAEEQDLTAPIIQARVHPDDRAAFVQAIPDTVTHGHAEVEHRLVRGDGTLRWVVSKGRLVLDGDGKPAAIVGTSQDVTDQKIAKDSLARSESALRASEEQMRQAQAIAHLGSWDADLSSGTIRWSEEAMRLYGVDPASPAPSYELFLARVHDEDRERVARLAGGAAQTGVPVEMEFRIVRPDGTCRTIHARTVPTKVGDKVTRLLGINLDITDLREAQSRIESAESERRRLEDIAAFKTRFLNTAAHEMATPLTPIRLQIANLRGGFAGALSESQKRTLDLLDRNMDRLGRLIGDLLDAARLQSGSMKLRKQQVDVNEIATDVAASFQHKAQEDGVALDVWTHGPAVAEVDADRVTQVLFNLTHNALKFTPRGGRILLDVEHDADQIRISCSDTGLGLSPEMVAQLFQPFTQVQGANQSGKGGTGLGLYISRGIAEQHGGSLVVKSDGPGKGTTFTLAIPVVATPADASVPVQEAVATAP